MSQLSAANEMAESLRRYLEDSQLIPKDSKVLVGVSGGADSTCLLHLLHALGYEVVAAHLHHGQRAEGADEQRRVRQFCESLGVAVAEGYADVPAIAKLHGIGVEEAGRRARYEFFEQAANRLGCELIATAHTRSDTAETVLFHLARGSGLSGVAGIPERRGTIVRPLLRFSRLQTIAYCQELGFEIAEDPSNKDLSLSRARIRHRVLPELEKAHPGAEASIARFAESARVDLEFLDSVAAAALDHCAHDPNGPLSFLTEDCEIVLARSRLLHLHESTLRRGTRMAVQALGGDLDQPLVSQLLQAIRTQPKASFTSLGGDVVVECEGDWVHFQKARIDTFDRQPIEAPGETESPLWNWRMEIREEAAPETQPRDSLTCWLDPSKVSNGLYARTLLPGERSQPLGFEGSRKLTDLIAEAKLTRAARKRIPVICDMIGPVWIPGVCLMDRAAARERIERSWRTFFGPYGSNNRRTAETTRSTET